PSTMFTCTLTVSPARKSGISLLSDGASTWSSFCMMFSLCVRRKSDHRINFQVVVCVHGVCGTLAAVPHRGTRIYYATSSAPTLPQLNSGSRDTSTACGSPFLRAQHLCRSACMGCPQVCTPSGARLALRAHAGTPHLQAHQ